MTDEGIIASKWLKFDVLICNLPGSVLEVICHLLMDDVADYKRVSLYRMFCTSLFTGYVQ